MKYSIEGEPMPVVICELEDGESMLCERGAMSWMSPNMQMETSSNGGVGKAIGRAFGGETMFINRYTATDGNGMIAFASSFPGCLRALDIAPGHEMVIQKHGFLACTMDVEMSVFFQKRLGSGFFGGEGFVMQKLSGSGTAFVELDGYIREYELGPDQQIVVDTGYVAAMDATCSMDIQQVKGVKNKVLGGEGFFNTTVTGPGKVWLQSMPICQMANALRPFLPSNN